MIDGLTIEPSQPEDRALILDSWLRSFEPRGLAGHERAKYYRNERVVAERCVSHGRVLVARVTELSGREIAGWICHAGNCVHYIYVKALLRGNGVATGLVSQALDQSKEIRFDHDTGSWRGFLRSLGKAGFTCAA